jgi:membrane protease YdiL (CAAX protease family)
VPDRAASENLLRLAVPFYSALLVIAALVGLVAGRNPFVLGNSPVVSLLLGAATAGGTVVLSLVAYHLLPTLRSLAGELGPRLVGGASRGELVGLAVLSGVGEEALFRGALQPLVGLIPASLLFGLLHVGPDRRYLAWTLSAVVAGFLFGLLYRTTGGLLAPVAAHVLHNAVMLLLWKRQLSGQAPGRLP